MIKRENLEKISWYDFSFWGNEKEYATEALNSTWLSGGSYIERLEKSLSATLDLPNVLAVANGTAALQLAYLGIGIEPNDEVIMPAFGFMAAANVLKLMHGVPVFVDVNQSDWCIDSAKIEEKITPKTKAIVTIHNYGVVANMKELQQIARKHGLYLIEDCAESIFSKFDGQYCGTFGDINTFSFHATKTIATGEGGMVSCKDTVLNDRMKLIRSHGLRREKKHYWHEYYGNNFRLSNILAAIGLGQFEQHQSILTQKKRVVERYRANLQGWPGVVMQGIPGGSDPLLWVVALYLDPAVVSISRDEILKELAECGIECRPGFYTPDQLEIYRNGSAERFPIANRLAAGILVPPSYPKLPDDKIDFISGKIKDIIGRK